MMKMTHIKIYRAFGLSTGTVYAEGDYVLVRRLLNNYDRVWVSNKNRERAVQAEFEEPIRIVERSAAPC